LRFREDGGDALLDCSSSSSRTAAVEDEGAGESNARRAKPEMPARPDRFLPMAVGCSAVCL
jgi:hypothetical protein